MKASGTRKDTGTRKHTVLRADARAGQVVVVAALGIIVMASISALAIDVGHIYAMEARLQNASDAAALAAAQKLVEERYDGEQESDARSAAVSEAETMMQENADGARCEVLFGAYAEGEFVAQDGDTAATAVRVVTHRDQDALAGQVPMFFAPLFGHEGANVRAAAVSVVTSGISAIGNGLRPFTISLGTIQDWNPDGTIVLSWKGKKGGADGAFGLLNLEGTAPSTNNLADWILNGYDDQVAIDLEVGHVWVDGEAGVRAALQNDVETIIGEHMIVAVHDEVTGQGNNTSFRIVRFVGITILGINLTGSNKQVTLRLDRTSYVPVSETDPSIQDNLGKIQLVQ